MLLNPLPIMMGFTLVVLNELTSVKQGKLMVLLTLCVLETPKRVLLQTVKTQIKCSIMLHFIRVYTVCKGKKDLKTKKYIFFKL